MLELEEQPVAAGGGERRREARARAGGMHVEEGEVALAQRDQVAVRAEVRLGVDRLPVARDGELQLLLGARADARRRRARRRSRRRRCAPASPGRAGRRGRRGRRRAGRPRASSPRPPWEKSANTRYEPASGRRIAADHSPAASCSGCRCWKPVRSRRATIRCMRLVCSTSKSRTVAPSASAIRKRRRSGRPRRSSGVSRTRRRPCSATARPRTGSGARFAAVLRAVLGRLGHARRGRRPRPAPRGR